jgi:hypothetical protein
MVRPPREQKRIMLRFCRWCQAIGTALEGGLFGIERHVTVIRFVVVVMAYAMALTRQFRNLKLMSTIIPLSL